MKRIKCEEIQNTIQNYVRQRNLTNNNYLNKYTLVSGGDTQNGSSAVASSGEHLSNTASDFSLMALNDLALIESSISDYCSFSFDSLSESEYMNQFERFQSIFLN